jgi:colanic acid biosynthesis glycosyl transferase WcaI
VTGIAQGLAVDHDVAVLSGQPSYAARGVRAPRQEVRRGVAIWRCRATTFDKDRLLFRLLNLATLSVSIFGNAVMRFRKGDTVVVVTNPPTLPFAALTAAWIRGARCVLLVHDVYPDVLVATGWFSRGSLVTRMIRAIQRGLYRSMHKIVVIGRDMEALLGRQLIRRDRIVIISNWADLADVQPADRARNALLAQFGLADKFVVQYSGNMGRTHGLENLLEAIEKLRAHEGIHFLLIGSGAKKLWVEQRAAGRRLANMTVLPYQPRDALAISLNACDLAVISFAPGMAGVSVPSRMYNVMAAGKPILAIADPNSELAQVVREDDIGWVVTPDKPEEIVDAILAAKSDPSGLAAMGARARTAAEQKYRYDGSIASYRTLLATSSQR